MPETLTTDYQSILDMPEEVSFFVFVAGITNGAHQEIITKLKRVGHREESFEKCDYCLVFCPIATRVGTDIEEALDNAPAGKPIILVVMHHTWDSRCFVAESRRLVNNENVKLTVDCLFHNESLLQSVTNNIAWSDIQKHFGLPQTSDPQCPSYMRKHAKKIFGVVVVVIILISLVKFKRVTDIHNKSEGISLYDSITRNYK